MIQEPQPKPMPATTYEVVWFAPDRPVEGSTIYVRSADERDWDRTLDSADANC